MSISRVSLYFFLFVSIGSAHNALAGSTPAQNKPSFDGAMTQFARERIAEAEAAAQKILAQGELTGERMLLKGEQALSRFVILGGLIGITKGISVAWQHTNSVQEGRLKALASFTKGLFNWQFISGVMACGFGIFNLTKTLPSPVQR